MDCLRGHYGPRLLAIAAAAAPLVPQSLLLRNPPAWTQFASHASNNLAIDNPAERSWSYGVIVELQSCGCERADNFLPDLTK